MTFTKLYALAVSILLIVEPFVLHSSFASAGTWFWWLLGLVGLFGMYVERAVLQRMNRQRAAKGIFS